MKISVSNIGLINRADIELDGITVIGGYNCSGKSTILKAIYSLLYSNSDIKKKIEEEKEKSFIQAVENSGSILSYLYSLLPAVKEFWCQVNEIFEKEQNLTLEQLNKVVEKKIKKENYFDKFEIHGIDDPEFKRNVIKKQIESLYEKLVTILKRNDSEYVRFIFFRNFQNIFKGNINSFGCKKNGNIKIEFDTNETFAEFKDNKMISCKSYPNFVNSIWYIDTCHFTDIINDKKVSLLLYSELRKALYKEVGIDVSFETFSDIEENTDAFANILKEILHGELITGESGSSLLYKDEKTNTSFDVKNVASGMKNMLVIQKLLQNGSLNRNSILLIDEPESNLHPEWQVKFAEILVLLNKELNIKIVINSHSPYFMRAVEVSLANYSLKDKGRFYVMNEDANGYFSTEDVTNNTDKIYEMLYKPLDYL